METKKNIGYIWLWLGQTVSRLGSATANYALVIWVYEETASEMAVSLLNFFSYMPFVLFSVLAGAFVDTHKKKPILLIADMLAAGCTGMVLLLFAAGHLHTWHIYGANFLIGSMHALQAPASAVTVGLLVPENRYARMSGLTSFSNSLVAVVSPVLATFLTSFWGLESVFFADIAGFFLACLVVLCCVHVPEEKVRLARGKRRKLLQGAREGFVFLWGNTGLFTVMCSMAVVIFFSRLTYENILPAMILSRSGGNSDTLGIVSGVLGLGGLLGSFAVVLCKTKKYAHMLYLSAAASFLFGDLFLGLGQSRLVWIAAALAASIPIPFIDAGQTMLLYDTVPKEMQGRVFSVRNTLQYFTIPIGTLLGGALAEYVFEPFMQGHSSAAMLLQRLVGQGKGSGMAVMFLCTGILGTGMSLLLYKTKVIRRLAKKGQGE